MGIAAPPEYRDDPDAVSLHTTPDSYAYDEASSSEPPSYADSEADAAPRPILHHVPPPTSRTNHNAPTFRNGKPQVCTTSTYMDARYDTDPIYLETAVREFATTAPTPLIYILGSHTETTKHGNKKKTHQVTDFRIVLDISTYLHPHFNTADSTPMSLTTAANTHSTHRGSIFKHRAPRTQQDLEPAAPLPSLTEWCHRFCASTAPLRVFRLTRTISGLDTVFLTNRLTGLLRATGYRGTVQITFPTEDANVDIYTTHRVNRWRTTTWICWVFYLSFLWLLTWPVLFFCTKKYAVVQAEWPFSVERDGRRVYTTVSEEEYVGRWGEAVQRLACEGFQGLAGEEVLRGVAGGGVGVEGQTALGVLAQGVRVARAMQGGSVRDSVRGVLGGLEGGWGYDC